MVAVHLKARLGAHLNARSNPQSLASESTCQFTDETGFSTACGHVRLNALSLPALAEIGLCACFD